MIIGWMEIMNIIHCNEDNNRYDGLGSLRFIDLPDVRCPTEGAKGNFPLPLVIMLLQRLYAFLMKQMTTA